MHWICPLYKLSTCWVFVEVLLSAAFKWPQQWLNMLSSPKISQRLMLIHHGWESLDTLGTARAWPQHVERCCANALDFVEPRMDDRETKKMLSRVELRVWPVPNLTQQDSTLLNTCQQVVQMRSTCWAQHVDSLYSGQIQCICTWLKEWDLATLKISPLHANKWKAFWNPAQ